MALFVLKYVIFHIGAFTSPLCLSISGCHLLDLSFFGWIISSNSTEWCLARTSSVDPFPYPNIGCVIVMKSRSRWIGEDNVDGHCQTIYKVMDTSLSYQSIINIMMHLFYYISLIALPLATLVYAQQDTPFYITSPLQGTIYKAGET